MSDTTSFLGGAAIAGLVALVVLRGGVSANQPVTPQVSPSSAIPSPIVSPLPSTPSTLAFNSDQQSEMQRLEAERLKVMLEQQKAETDKLKEQLQRQQGLLEALTAQSKANSANPAALSGADAGSIGQSNSMIMGVLWAMGGAILGLGGGILILGVLSAIFRQQRTSRTIEVIHPVEEYQTYLPPSGRYSQPYTTRRAPKRVRRIDDD